VFRAILPAVVRRPAIMSPKVSPVAVACDLATVEGVPDVHDRHL
jgi:hypothetical protein